MSDSLLISVAAMAVYTGFVFMPQHIMAILHYFEVIQWPGLQPFRLLHGFPLVVWNRSSGLFLFAFGYWKHKAFGELNPGKSDDEQTEYKPVHCHVCGYGPCTSAQSVRLYAHTALLVNGALLVSNHCIYNAALFIIIHFFALKAVALLRTLNILW